MARPLAQVGVEILETVKDSLVLVDLAASEALRWSVGLAALLDAGAQSIQTPPWELETVRPAKKIIFVLGRLLHECQNDMKLLLELPNTKTCHVYSLFSDTDNLSATAGEFGFQAFSTKCQNFLLAANAAPTDAPAAEPKPVFRLDHLRVCVRARVPATRVLCLHSFCLGHMHVFCVGLSSN
jgi:hypothetical protein